MRTYFYLIACIFLCFVLPEVGAARVLNSKSIVKIFVTRSTDDYSRPWLKNKPQTILGSGFIIADNKIITNAHMVSAATFINVRKAGSATKYQARLEAISYELDLAILIVKDSNFFVDAEPLQFANIPDIGDKVINYGFPKGGSKLTLTEGIVSRIDFQKYNYSRKSNLVYQTDAAVNGGVSGGPTLSTNNKVVGMSFQGKRGQNIGYLIPSIIIKQFLQDIEDGQVNGMPVFPFYFQNLENSQLRTYYHMSQDMSGIRIDKISPSYYKSEKLLLPDDIILSINDYLVGNDGTIEFRPNERVSYRFLLSNKQIGESVTLKLLREGKIISRTLPLNITRDDRLLINWKKDNDPPTYYVIAGYVFSPLSRKSIGFSYMGYRKRLVTNKNHTKKNVIVLVNVLHDEINDGLHHSAHEIVSKVNGRQIFSMKDLVDAFEQNTEEFHYLEFEDKMLKIAINRKEATIRSPKILKKYKVPFDRSENLSKLGESNRCLSVLSHK